MASLSFIWTLLPVVENVKARQRDADFAPLGRRPEGTARYYTSKLYMMYLYTPLPLKVQCLRQAVAIHL